MIYLIKSADYYKIGYTADEDAEDRIKALQVGNPYQISLVSTWEGGVPQETALHKQFAHRRVRGEWFALTDEDVQSIGRATADGRLPTVSRRAAQKKFPVALPPIDRDQRYTVEEAAMYLRVSRAHLFKRIQTGLIEPIRDGRRMFITGQELARFGMTSIA